MDKKSKNYNHDKKKIKKMKQYLQKISMIKIKIGLNQQESHGKMGNFNLNPRLKD